MVSAAARGVLACSLGLVSAPAVATAQEAFVDAAAGSADAAAIVKRALEQGMRQQESAAELGFEYVTEGTVEFLDGDGNVTRTETTRRRHYPLDGYLYSELIERDGRPLDAGDARAERKRKTDFVREVKRHAARGERYEPDEMSVDFDADLMDRYHATFAGTDVVRGDSCWVIRFEPREGRLPDNRRIDKALNRAAGFLWITQDDQRVARVTFEMQRPFRWLWGIAGTLRHARGQFELQWIEPHLWGLADSRMEIDLGVFFGMKSVRRRIRNAWVEQGSLEAEARLR